ncbi:hypothetical protein Kpol_1002p55 [Vanderwaltozyma polyspora DSM 70294]|uniref:Biogenesis of lysosome-related organelles complex 1 subunit KXD1 n=1 Tax=Vanderwaltozyma polyspora (strain ATCC 22028 / DSM 70294 / BCRC 21397 / CBS 2163 / NBRC 10782 / NRRL Y-8283 / UCD 57-17) TaxID=436907 RepID=KXD1_VANPO|nr:uncharacterized protein Kpol_1002p55 [Vanderwaltozyma polyspora DSM 70294]A7TE86.1 RecName: Full=Biogenesis of lysosome-related organelles complex 1 subunit KXD1; Short=BLOC-1 subunit KXD1; AltName: Full=KxDL homolog [Vanderwaltozyma polyspora DSM 70294]EDO19408.1 hypothetical protein Kpol_1002p55 [Vanderwaltozyma polyspora DSM 70294]
MSSDGEEGSFEGSQLVSQSPSINSQTYAIPIPEGMLDQLDISSSSSSAGGRDDEDEEDDDADVDVGVGSECLVGVTGQDRLIIGSGDDSDNGDGDEVHDNAHATSDVSSTAELNHVCSEETEDMDNVDEGLLDDIMNNTGGGGFVNGFEFHESEPMFDVSKYVFETLIQAINSADFSESLAFQTKTSAVINAKSLELKQLINMSKDRLVDLQDKFEKGVQTSNRIKRNLKMSREKIQFLNDEFRTNYPIEFNQARDKIIERTIDS